VKLEQPPPPPPHSRWVGWRVLEPTIKNRGEQGERVGARQ
jgi:hypothetical protein